MARVSGVAEPGTDAGDDDSALEAAFTTFFAKESPSARVRAAEPLGFDPSLWDRLRGLGIPELAVGVDRAPLDALATIVRCAGRALAPVPIVETLVANRLLDRLDACREPLANGEGIATFAVRPARGGVWPLVPAGAVATAVVGMDGDDLVLLRAPAPGSAAVNLGGAPLADRSVTGDRTVLATGSEAHDLHALTLDEMRILWGAALVGLGRGALDGAVAYAADRHQFGVPIGSFQAIQHRLADVATELDGATLLVGRAAASEGTIRAVLAPLSAWVAGRAARAVAGANVHVHGGYGFMLEVDAQLFFRRASAWPLVLGDPADEMELIADQLARVGWNLDDPEPSAFRREVRAFLETHCPAEVVRNAHDTGTMHDWGLHAALARVGWLAAEWPVDQGGQARGPWEMQEMHDELARVGAPVDGWGTSNLVAHTLALVGTDQQRSEIVPRILDGSVLCCLGYSEPDSGSDVAAASTRAERDGDDWVINGQKMFTTLAHESTYVFLLTRTNPDAPKHRGLTMFLVPMDAPGIEITPIHTLGGERTNITYYTDVRVPDACRVGAVDGGWSVMGVALAFERNPTMVGELDRLLHRFVEWAATVPGVLDRPATRVRLVHAVADLEVARVLAHRMTAVAASGTPGFVEGSMAKLFASEALVRAAADLLDASAPEGLLGHDASGAVADGWIEQAHRHAQVTTIYAGTSEIQRSIIAERGLGLPRSGR